VKIIPEVPITEQRPKDRRIAWWVENTVIRSVKRIINDLGDSIRKVLSFSISDFVEDFEKDLIELVRPIAEYILATPKLPHFVRKPIQEAMTGEKQAGLAILAVLVGALAMAISSGIAEPVGKLMAQVVNQILVPTLVDPGTLIAMWRRGFISHSQLDTWLGYHGYGEKARESLKKISERLIDESTLTQAFWREKISDAEVSTQLEHRGFSPKEVALWKEARNIIPGPQDLISMAVREAFNDRIASQFGYDEDRPEEAKLWARRQGLSGEWFDRYWRAHWQLPGLVQVREMYQRGFIDENEVDLYLTAADIPSFWRTAIKKWMRSEVTRVDLRRMYDLGVITIDEVFDRYVRIGYTPEDARKLTEWTEKQYLETERELTKSDILTMYQEGLLNSMEATTYLSSLDYQDESIMLLLAHRDLKRQQKYESTVISNTKKLYIKGIYDKTDVFAILGKLDTPGTFIEETLQVWDLEKKALIAVPTVTQFRDMVLADVITIEDFRKELLNKGYKPVSIKRYVKLWFTEETE